jgi:hypothetical protein
VRDGVLLPPPPPPMVAEGVVLGQGEAEERSPPPPPPPGVVEGSGVRVAPLAPPPPAPPPLPDTLDDRDALKAGGDWVGPRGVDEANVDKVEAALAVAECVK